MPKIFKAGDIVQWLESKSGLVKDNPDGYVFLGPEVLEIFRNHWKSLGDKELYFIGLNKGDVRCSSSTSDLVHTHRVKGLVKVKDEVEYPKKVDDEYSCTSQHPDVNYTGFHWSCEREVGHPGDHMAWQKYPHHLYEGGVWQQTKKVEAAQQADEVSVELNDDDIPF